MAVPPRLPTSLDAKDMAWVRWVTQKLQEHDNQNDKTGANLLATAQQRSSAQTTIAGLTDGNTIVNGVLAIRVPTAPPQTPSAPLLTTDHGTVTITWNGKVHASLTYTPVAGDDPGSLVDPQLGFNRVNVFRSDSQNGTYAPINTITTANTSAVDADVKVGSTYWYRFTTTDNLGIESDPGLSVSIVVKGVDLGTLDQDVTDALAAAASAAQAGIDAAKAGHDAADAAATAASTADAKAAQALLNAGTAQSRADAAYSAAQTATGTKEIYFGTTAPSDTTGNMLWIDTTNGANTPKHYVSGAWVAITDKAATDAAAAAAAAKTAADNAQTTANTALTNAGAAQTTATNALTAANGKNKVIYSPSPASGTGYTDGDLWWQTSNGAVVGQWQYNTGNSTWVPMAVAGSIVAAGINAANITAGFINSARIQANTITATQMVAGTITAASGILADAVITNAKIADLAVNTAKIADLAVNNAKINDLDGNKIQAATIVAGKLAADSVTTNNIVAGSIDTNRIAAGAITTAKLTATAIDGMTITGAVFRTSPTASTNGVVLDASGMRGYQNNAQTFYVDSNGNVGLIGAVNATSGYITGTMVVNGGLYTSTGFPRTELTNSGMRVWTSDGRRMQVGDSGGSRRIEFYDASGTRSGYINGDSDQDLNINFRDNLNLMGQNGASELILGNDGTPRLRSMTVWNRDYDAASADTTDPDSGSVNSLMLITPAGTIGRLGSQGTVFLPNTYEDAVSTRAVYVNAAGRLGTTSSALRTKDLIAQVPMTDDVLKTWTSIPTWVFNYKADETKKMQIGMVAEEVLDAGFAELVYFNEKTGAAPMTVDGFAYERMGVYNKLAIGRLLERVEMLEAQVATLTGGN